MVTGWEQRCSEMGGGYGAKLEKKIQNKGQNSVSEDREEIMMIIRPSWPVP